MLRFHLDGEERLARMLSFETLAGGDYRGEAVNLLRRIDRYLRRRSPIKTGHLRAGIVTRLDSGPLPRFLDVRSTAVSSRGFDYGQRLDLSTRTHYRQGPLAGSATRGWWSGAMPEAGRLVDQFVGRVARAIERNFAGGVR